MADSRLAPVLELGAVIITGGSRGIGLGTAHELVSLGFRKFILGYCHNDEDAEAAKTVLENNDGVKVVLLKGDVAKQSTVDTYFKVVDAEFDGCLYAIIHNAGRWLKSETEHPEETLEEYHGLYPRAFRRLVEQGVPYMERSAHGGRIIAVSNPGVNLMSSPRPTYLFPGSAKAAMEYMARHYARALAPKRIACNVIIPGITLTSEWGTVDPVELARKRCPMKEVIQPRDVGAAIAFLTSPKASFITGAMLPVDGGLLFE